MHVTVFSTRGKVTEFEIVTSDDGKPELRSRCGSSQLIVPMDEHQLVEMVQDINRHLARRLRNDPVPRTMASGKPEL